MNIPEYYEELSIRLTEVLDAAGLGEDLRWQRINTWLQIEELDQIFLRMIDDTNCKFFYFGSQAEATTTDQLLSDLDRVRFLETEEVIQDLQFWASSPDTMQTFLMVADDSTPPGYVKLQLVWRDAPIPIHNYQDEIIRLDSKRRSVLGNNTTHVKSPIAHEYHGPANTTYNLGMTMDNVCALHTRCWPDQACRWLSSRNRKYNWPTRRTINVIQTTGALLVPVGHKLSPEHHLEWRLSFSFGEKLLTWQFNSTQYKCYVMLKFIKNAFINVRLKERLLTSYHCKTCMFYLIESTPDSLWHPNRLLFCIDLCLRQLLSWVECNNCPNYFIADENMFLGRCLGLVQQKTTAILHDLLRQKGKYITMIPHERIGENVARVCQSLPMKLDHANKKTLQITCNYLEHILKHVCVLAANLNFCKPNIFKSSHGLRQGAQNIVRSVFCSSLGNHLASQSLKEEIPDQEKLGMAHELLLCGSSYDAASGTLKLAAFYLAQSNLDTMEELLNHLDAKLTHSVWENGGEMVRDCKILSKILRENLSIAKLVQNHLALPVCYGPLDIYSIPKVLCFEMFRSTGSENRFGTIVAHWIPIAEVRARLYLYFLQFQCFHLRGRKAHRSVALNNMIWISKLDLQTLDICLAYTADVSCLPDLPNLKLGVLSTVTTALNLLAYCLKQDGRLMEAFNVLCKSMKIINQHNAAKWQIATFITTAVRISNTRQEQ